MSEVNCPCIFSPGGFEHNCPIHDPSPPSDPQREGSETGWEGMTDAEMWKSRWERQLTLGAKRECEREKLEAKLTAAREALEAANRIIKGGYLMWGNVGGPDECAHGRASGIPCPLCDKILVSRTLSQLNDHE